jgi:hypothetical protein
VYCILFWTEIKKIWKLLVRHEIGQTGANNQGLPVYNR